MGPRNLLSPSRPSSLCSLIELLSAPFLGFSMATRSQRACEWKEWGLQWKKYLVSDSCLQKKTERRRKTKRRRKVWESCFPPVSTKKTTRVDVFYCTMSYICIQLGSLTIPRPWLMGLCHTFQKTPILLNLSKCSNDKYITIVLSTWSVPKQHVHLTQAATTDWQSLKFHPWDPLSGSNPHFSLF